MTTVGCAVETSDFSVCSLLLTLRFHPPGLLDLSYPPLSLSLVWKESLTKHAPLLSPSEILAHSSQGHGRLECSGGA